MDEAESEQNAISEGEYDRWMSTTDAKNLLASQDGWSGYAAAETITQRLSDGLIDAVAKTLIWKFKSKRESHAFRFVRFGYWPRKTKEDYDGFWKSGDITIDLPQEGHSISAGPTISLYSVRFRPEHIVEIMPPVGNVSALGEKSEQPTTPIAKGELGRFCQLYIEIWGERGTEQKALAACQAMYPQNKVSRDPFRAVFREIRGPGTPGKKPIRG